MRVSFSRSNEPYFASDRHAFTLVEMLVVITVLLVLASVTVTSINFSLEGERVRSSARQLQSYLLGARDRAAYSQLPRGVRFETGDLTDPANYRFEDVNGDGVLDPSEDLNNNGIFDKFPLVRSMVYIGASKDWSQGTVTVHVNALTKLPNLIHGDFSEWYRLNEADLNRNGGFDSHEDINGNGRWDRLLIENARIKLGSRWYTVHFLEEQDINNNGNLDPGENINGNYYIDNSTGDRLPVWDKLGPHQDRTASHPPDLTNWLVIDPPFVNPQPNPMRDPNLPLIHTEVAARFDEGDYRLTLTPRVLPSVEPVQFADRVVVDLFFSRPPDKNWSLMTGAIYRDIMFSPQGSVIGPPATAGVVHFLLNDQADITRGLVPWDPRNENDKRIITLFTRTGNITTNELFPGETSIGVDVNLNGVIDPGYSDPFYYAETGRVSE
jgi:prepilin-type N-terminal cleavage/methylation domain-containing protein